MTITISTAPALSMRSLGLAAGFWAWAAAASTACSAQIFDGYEDYYASLPNRLFSAADQRPLQRDTAPSGRFRPHWTGVLAAGSKRHVVELDGADVLIDGRRFAAAKARRFKSERPADWGPQASLYVRESAVCIEGVPPSASGTAARHVHVSLILQPFAKRPGGRFELPSLFGSCLNLAQGAEAGTLRFFEVAYRWPDGHSAPQGVDFIGQALRDGRFMPTPERYAATFTSPGNVYRFEVSDSLQLSGAGAAAAPAAGSAPPAR